MDNNDLKDIKYLIEKYHETQETEEYDDFLDIFGDYDEICDELIRFIEKNVLKNS